MITQKFIPCRKCRDKYTVEGYTLGTKAGYPTVKECSCHKLWREAQDLIYRAERSKIWADDISLNYNPMKEYKGVSSKGEMIDLVKFTQNFDKKEIKELTLYLWGANSTQKTTLSQWVGLEVLRQKYTVQYLTMQHCIRILSDFEEREDLNEMVEHIKNVDLLILDEAFDKKKVTLYKSGFQLPFIEEFLKERIESRKKSTIFVSNVPVAKIAEQGFDISIQRFIERNVFVTGTDLEFRDNYLENISSIDTERTFDKLELKDTQ